MENQCVKCKQAEAAFDEMLKELVARSESYRKDYEVQRAIAESIKPLASNKEFAHKQAIELLGIFRGFVFAIKIVEEKVKALKTK